MADQELVAYMRQHLKRFGAPALKAKLLEEGLSEAEIHRALQAALEPPAKKPRPLIYLLFAVTTVLVGAFLVFNRPHSSFTPTIPAKDEKMFIGHGYVLKPPENYNMISEFKDPKKEQEVVYLFPKNVDPSNLADEGLYAQLGILRLEVSPRRTPQGWIGMEAVRSGVTATLQSRKAVFTAQETQAGGMPAYLIEISSPFPLVQAFVVGTKVLYVLTGGNHDSAFNDTLVSLHETSRETPTEPPISDQDTTTP